MRTELEDRLVADIVADFTAHKKVFSIKDVSDRYTKSTDVPSCFAEISGQVKRLFEGQHKAFTGYAFYKHDPLSGPTIFFPLPDEVKKILNI